MPRRWLICRHLVVSLFKQSSEPNRETRNPGSSGDSSLEGSALVSSTLVHAVKLPSSDSSTRQSSIEPRGSVHGGSCSHITYLRSKLAGENLSEVASNLILSCWRTKSNQSYNSLFGKWVCWCPQLGSDHISGPVSEVANFLAHIPSKHHGGLAILSVGPNPVETHPLLSLVDLVSNWNIVVTGGSTWMQTDQHPGDQRFLEKLLDTKSNLTDPWETWTLSLQSGSSFLICAELRELYPSPEPIAKVTLDLSAEVTLSPQVVDVSYNCSVVHLQQSDHPWGIFQEGLQCQLATSNSGELMCIVFSCANYEPPVNLSRSGAFNIQLRHHVLTLQLAPIHILQHCLNELFSARQDIGKANYITSLINIRPVPIFEGSKSCLWGGQSNIIDTYVRLSLLKYNLVWMSQGGIKCARFSDTKYLIYSKNV